VFSKSIKFLLCIYSQARYSQDRSCSEMVLQEKLKISYKQVHCLAKVWEGKRLIKSFTQRGGVSSYKITDLGLIESEKLMQQQKKYKIMGIFVGILGFCIYFFLGY
jgi:hypothetical protein